MDEHDEPSQNVATPGGKSEAEIFLESELTRCRAALVAFEAGETAMRDGQSRFDEVWEGIVRNAARHYGRQATREALEAMGRSEDVGLMY